MHDAHARAFLSCRALYPTLLSSCTSGAFGSTGPAEPGAAPAEAGSPKKGGKGGEGGKGGKGASKSPAKARLA